MAKIKIKSLDDVYRLLKDGYDLATPVYFQHEKTKHNEIKTTLGRVWFNLLLPDQYKFIDEEVSKTKLNNQIMQEILEKFGPEIAAQTVKRIYKEAFKLASIKPITFESEYVEPPQYLIEKRNELAKWIERENPDPEEVTKKINKLQKEYEEWIKEHDLKLYYAVKGGAKGSIMDWASMTLIRGYTADVRGEISKKPIVHSMNEGYDIHEWKDAANQSRRALYLQSTHAAEPGYLARKVVFATDHIVLDKKDCNTKKYWKLTVTEKIAKAINGRYYFDGTKLRKITDGTKLIGKQIKLRSPLYCKSKTGVCPICYGELAQVLDTDRLGITAGAIVNNVMLGLVLKAKHMLQMFNLQPVNFRELLKTTPDIFEYFEVEKTEIRAKYNTKVYLDRTEYTELVDYADFVVVPGVLTFTIEDKHEVEIGLTFNVKLFKTTSTSETEDDILIEYSPGEVIIRQEYADMAPSFDAVKRLLEAQVKYIKSPEILTLMIHDLMSRAKSVDLVHIELIVANMFRCADDLTVPCRLKGTYKNSVVLGQKKLPHVDSWLKAVAFEHIDKALTDALIRQQPAKMTPLEQLLITGGGE